MKFYSKEIIQHDRNLREIMDLVSYVLHSKRRMGNKLNAIMDIIAQRDDWTYRKTSEARMSERKQTEVVLGADGIYRY